MFPLTNIPASNDRNFEKWLSEMKIRTEDIKWKSFRSYGNNDEKNNVVMNNKAVLVFQSADACKILLTKIEEFILSS